MISSTIHSITIKEPCHENWQGMTGNEKGRFCDACQKTVHDFSNFSVDEIKQQIEKSNGSICGRISTATLQKQYVQTQTKRVHFSYLKTFCFAALICFGATLFTINSAKASVFNQLKNKMLSVKSDTSHMSTIKGVIRDKATQETIPFANVVLTQNDVVIAIATSDIDGNYKLVFDRKKYTKLDLKVTYVGYQSVIIENILLKNDNLIDLTLNMELSGGEMLTGVIDVEYTTPLIDSFQSGKTINREDYGAMPK